MAYCTNVLWLVLPDSVPCQPLYQSGPLEPDLSNLGRGLLTYFCIFKATGMKFEPCVLFCIPMSVVDLSDLDGDLLTYFHIFEASAMKFGPCVLFAYRCHWLNLVTLTMTC